MRASSRLPCHPKRLDPSRLDPYVVRAILIQAIELELSSGLAGGTRSRIRPARKGRAEPGRHGKDKCWPVRLQPPALRGAGCVSEVTRSNQVECDCTRCERARSRRPVAGPVMVCDSNDLRSQPGAQREWGLNWPWREAPQAPLVSLPVRGDALRFLFGSEDIALFELRPDAIEEPFAVR